MSIMQAERVETLLRARGVRLNGPWQGRAVVSGVEGPPVEFRGGMHITMLSPTPKELEPLARKWEEYRSEKRGGTFEDEHTEDRPRTAAQSVGTGSNERALYIASAHDDREWRSRLMAALKLVFLPGQVFPDEEVSADDGWRQQSRTAIEQSRVAVVLVSPAALASPFLMQEELPALVEAAEHGRLLLTWMVVAPCDWTLARLEKYQAVRPPNVPLNKLPDIEAARELTRIAETLAQQAREPRAAPAAVRRQRGVDDGPIDVEALLGRPYVPDRSVANNSSLAFVAEVHGTAVLICGDASAEVLAASIRTLLSRRGQRRLRVDAFVVPHNGSARNLTRELLELLDCERYLVSTNGSTFRHPDRETIARILAFGRAEPNRPLTLVFNYRTEWTSVWDDPALKARWKYEAIYPSVEGGGIKVQI